MPNTSSSQVQKWPHKVTIGRSTVTIYKGKTPAGNDRFRVENYSTRERRFDPYGTEAEALEAATKLARQLSQMDVISASMTREQSIEYKVRKVVRLKRARIAGKGLRSRFKSADNGGEGC